MKKTWTDDEINYLIQSWSKIQVKEIISTLERSEDSVVRKARRLGLDVRVPEENLLKKRWTEAEDNFLKENYGVISVEDIEARLNRTHDGIKKRAKALGLTSTIERWTSFEENYLEEKWGIVTVEAIAKKLNRSKNAIILKAYQMGLRNQVEANGTYLTPKDICTLLNINIRTLYSWLTKNLIEHKKFRVGKIRKYQVTVDAFCEFLENNLDKWDSREADLTVIKSYYASYTMAGNGVLKVREELPPWLAEKIAADKNNGKKIYKSWTTKEEQELIYLFNSKSTYKDICGKLGRTIGAVKTRVHSLNR